MIHYSSQSGFSLVETLVAISILLVATVGPMTIAAKALQSAQYSREQNTAFFLAQEGIEAVFAFRNEAGLAHVNNAATPSDTWLTNWRITPCRSSGNGCGFHFIDNQVADNPVISCTTAANNPCRLYYDADDNRARYSHQVAGGTLTTFTRAVFVDPLPDGAARVTSRVTWVPGPNQPRKTLDLETFLYDIYDTTN